MSASELLADLRQGGVTLVARGGRLSIDAPEGLLTDEMRRSISEHKLTRLTLLEAEVARAEWERLEAEHGEMNQRMFELWEEGDRDAAKRLQADLLRLLDEEWHPARVRLARLEHRLGRLHPADAWLVNEPDDSAGGPGRVPTPRPFAGACSPAPSG